MKTLRVFSPIGRTRSPDGLMLNGIPDLDGLTIGLLDNTKPNARQIMDAIGRYLVDERGAAEVIIERKRSAAEPASAEIIRRLSGAAHLVFAGSGD